MYEYDTIIAGDVTLVKDGDTWTCDGEPVAYPWDVVQDAIEGHDYFEVQAIRADGVVDQFEYHAGYLYHITLAVNK